MSQYSSPKIWGPHFWFIMRCVANNYPTNPTHEDANHIKNFFTELQYILPCDICKYTYRQHVKRNPIENGLKSREKLVDWVEEMYDYTKKVISDKRIKVMDPVIEDSDGDVKPIKIVFKSKKSDLENKINDLAKNIKSRETQNNFINGTEISSKYSESRNLGTSSERPNTSIPKYENRNQKDNKVYKMETKDNFEKISSGRRRGRSHDNQSIRNPRNNKDDLYSKYNDSERSLNNINIRHNERSLNNSNIRHNERSLNNTNIRHNERLINNSNIRYNDRSLNNQHILYNERTNHERINYTMSEKPSYINREQDFNRSIVSSSRNRIKNFDKSSNKSELILTRRCNKCDH